MDLRQVTPQPNNKYLKGQSPVTENPDVNVEGVMGRPLWWALRISKFACAAPLHFNKLNGCRVQYSLATDFCSNITSILICFLALSTLLIDSYIEPERSLRTHVSSSRFVFIFDLAVMMMVVFAITFTGSKRMRSMMVYMNQINKINIELDTWSRRPEDDREGWRLLIITICGGLIIIVSDYVNFMYKVVLNNAKIIISSTYVTFHLTYTMRLAMVIEFALIALTALATLERVNACLKELIQDITTSDDVVTIQKKLIMMDNYVIPTKSFNHLVDTLFSVSKPSEMTNATISPRTVTEAIHCLARLHNDACNVVRQIDSCHGLVLLTNLLSFFLQLLMTLYRYINSLLMDVQSTCYNPVIQVMWTVYDVCGLIIIVECCHQTHKEMENTKLLISQVAERALMPSFQLEILLRQLTHNQVFYSPMKMLTVNRAFLVSMIGVMTTYLVAVINFK